MSLCLSFYGDGPYWDNTVLLPAYPTGYSYFRPFRYRDTWIQPDVLARVTKEPAWFVGQPATLCMRFRADDARVKLVPIRAVALTAVKRAEDTFVYFKMGSFFDFRDVESLSDYALPLPANVDGENNGKTVRRLFFEGALTLPPSARPADDAEMWSKLGELIAREATLPIKEEARKALFFHFETPARETAASVLEIGSSWVAGAKFGASIPEAKTYELVLLQRIPYLINTEGSIETIGATVRAANLHVVPPTLRLSANYNRHVLTVTGSRPTPTWDEIEIVPEARVVEAASGDTISVEPLMIPVRATRNWPHQVLHKIAPLVILAAALAANGIIGQWNLVKSDGWLMIGVAAAAIIASGAVLKIRD